MKQILMDFGIKLDHTLIYYDNTSAINLTNTSVVNLTKNPI